MCPTVLIAVVHWYHFRHILKHKHIVSFSICLCFRMCLIQLKKKNESRKRVLLFQESVFVSFHHVTLLLTDMWQRPHANPRPACNHMISHPSLVYAKWATWITDLIPSGVNYPNKDKPTISHNFISIQFFFASLSHCPSLTTAGVNTGLSHLLKHQIHGLFKDFPEPIFCNSRTQHALVWNIDQGYSLFQLWSFYNETNFNL